MRTGNNIGKLFGFSFRKLCLCNDDTFLWMVLNLFPETDNLNNQFSYLCHSPQNRTGIYDSYRQNC